MKSGEDVQLRTAVDGGAIGPRHLAREAYGGHRPGALSLATGAQLGRLAASPQLCAYTETLKSAVLDEQTSPHSSSRFPRLSHTSPSYGLSQSPFEKSHS
jgi:hypothetical protein